MNFSAYCPTCMIIRPIHNVFKPSNNYYMKYIGCIYRYLEVRVLWFVWLWRLTYALTYLLFPAEGAEQLRTQWDRAGWAQYQDLCGELSLEAVRSFCVYGVDMSYFRLVESLVQHTKSVLCFRIQHHILFHFILWFKLLISSLSSLVAWWNTAM